MRSAIRSAFDRDLERATELQGGGLSRVFVAHVEGRAQPVIVKLPTFPGLGAQEAAALTALRACAPVPEVFAYVQAPEAIVMEYLPGESGRALAQLEGKDADRAAHSIVELMMTINAQHSETFGAPREPRSTTWTEYFLDWIKPYEAKGAHVVSEAARKSRAVASTILSSAPKESSLIHGDFCLGNLLYDPDTLTITGLIDPLDATWGDPVLDLIHLTKSDGHRLRLLERAIERAAIDDDAMTRYWFYMFWRWLSYDVRFGYNTWLETCARTLLERIG